MILIFLHSVAFQKCRSSCFYYYYYYYYSRHVHPNAKMWLLNFDFYQFSNSKRLQKHVKRGLYIDFEGNLYSCFFLCTQFRCHIRFALPLVQFLIFTKTWKHYLYICLALFIKFDVSLFISFRDMKRWMFPTQSHAYTNTCVLIDKF